MKKSLQLFIVEVSMLTFATYRNSANWILFSLINITIFIGYIYLLYTWNKRLSLNPYTNLIYLWIKLFICTLCLKISSEGVLYLVLSYIIILFVNYNFRKYFKRE